MTSAPAGLLIVVRVARRALVLAALAAPALAPAASATTIKTLAGATVSTGSTISGGLKSGTTWHLEGGSAGDVDCSTSTLAGTLGTNPFTPSVTGSLRPTSFGSCTDTIPFATVSSVTMTSTFATFTYVAPPGSSTLALAGVEITVTFSSGSTCMYQPIGGTATASHNSTAGNNEYLFNAVPMTKTGGTFGFCPSTPTLTATYLAVRTSDSAGITIQA